MAEWRSAALLRSWSVATSGRAKLFGPALVGTSAVTAGLSGILIQLGDYLVGLMVMLVGGVVAVVAEWMTAIAPDVRRSRARSAKAGVVPRQLPRGSGHFVGREAELHRLSSRLERRGFADAVPITAISGMAGIGKTAVAVHWGRAVAAQFPDGQLYVDLRGVGPGEPLDPAEALRGFIAAFGVSVRSMPQELGRLSAAFSGLLWHKRVLVVLDNARDEEQVRHLLPTSPSCFVVITSRDQLPGLKDRVGAEHVALDVLSDAEARRLIVSHVGRSRVGQNPTAIADIVSLCARLPLALTVAAATAAGTPGVPLALVVDEIRRSRERLTVPGHAGESAFHWSYVRLSKPAQRAFRMLSLHPAQPFTVEAAASLVGDSAGRVGRALAELGGVHMLDGTPESGFVFHDLLREHSIQVRARTSQEIAVERATQRMLDFYLRTAVNASRRLNPSRPVPSTPPAAKVVTVAFASREEAMAWMDGAFLLLLEMIHVAHRAGLDSYTWRIAGTMAESLDRNAHWRELAAAMEVTGESARRAGSVEGEALSLRWLGRAQFRLDDLDGARASFTRATRLFLSVDHWNGAAYAYHNLALLEEHLGRHDVALSLVERSLPLFAASNDEVGRGRGLNAIGWYHTLLGRHADAAGVCEEALRALRAVDDRHGQADTLDSLGHAYLHLGDLDRSIEVYREAVGLYRDIGNLASAAFSLGFLGESLLASGRAADAEESWRDALQILDTIGQPDEHNLAGRLAARR